MGTICDAKPEKGAFSRRMKVMKVWLLSYRGTKSPYERANSLCIAVKMLVFTRVMAFNV
jgi:hypothetical protein